MKEVFIVDSLYFSYLKKNELLRISFNRNIGLKPGKRENNIIYWHVSQINLGDSLYKSNKGYSDYFNPLGGGIHEEQFIVADSAVNKSLRITEVFPSYIYIDYRNVRRNTGEPTIFRKSKTESGLVKEEEIYTTPKELEEYIKNSKDNNILFRTFEDINYKEPIIIRYKYTYY